jgi:hypothetical protein
MLNPLSEFPDVGGKRFRIGTDKLSSQRESPLGHWPHNAHLVLLASGIQQVEDEQGRCGIETLCRLPRPARTRASAPRTFRLRFRQALRDEGKRAQAQARGLKNNVSNRGRDADDRALAGAG